LLRGRKRTIISLGVGLALLAALVYKSGPADFAQIIGTLEPGFWLAAFFLYLIAQLISCYRWHLLLKAEKIELPLRRLTIFYFLGMFFNLFLPTMVGGDAARGYAVYRASDKQESALVSVLVDRFCGMGALMTIGFAAMLLSYSSVASTGVVGPLSFLMGLFLLSILLLVNVNILRTPLKFIFRGPVPNWAMKLVRVYEAFRVYGAHKEALIKAGVLSFLVQGLGIVVYYFLARALGLTVPLIYFFLFVPIITAVSLIPITFSGLGVREGMALMLFSRIGVPAPVAISLTLSWWITVAVMTLLAAPFWVRKGMLG
jgi:uncharacterized protein (TIRG00374 family)